MNTNSCHQRRPDIYFGMTTRKRLFSFFYTKDNRKSRVHFAKGKEYNVCSQYQNVKISSKTNLTDKKPDLNIQSLQHHRSNKRTYNTNQIKSNQIKTNKQETSIYGGRRYKITWAATRPLM